MDMAILGRREAVTPVDATVNLGATEEPDALRARVADLEAALLRIAREVAPVLDYPEVSFMTVQRIASVTKRAIRGRRPRARAL